MKSHKKCLHCLSHSNSMKSPKISTIQSHLHEIPLNLHEVYPIPCAMNSPKTIPPTSAPHRSTHGSIVLGHGRTLDWGLYWRGPQSTGVILWKLPCFIGKTTNQMDHVQEQTVGLLEGTTANYIYNSRFLQHHMRVMIGCNCWSLRYKYLPMTSIFWR